MNKGKIIAIIGGTIVGLGLIGSIFSIKIVPAGNTGVKVKMGSVQETTLSEGVHFRVPFLNKIILVNNRTQIANVDGNSASKDLQTVETSIAVNFRVKGEDSAKLFKNVGTEYIDVIITPAIQESTKSVFAKYTAEELITRRSEVSENIKAELSNKVSSYGIVIENLNITNCDFSEEFNKAIESKQTATQEALKAQENTTRITEEAKQKVIQAQGEADANTIKSNSINDNILKQQTIEKWDGKMPTVIGNEGNVMDISSLFN